MNRIRGPRLFALGMLCILMACAALASADVYMVDETALFRVTPTGSLSTVFSGPPFVSPRGVAVGFDGTTFVADFGAAAVFKVTPAGVLTTLHSGSPFISPRALTFEASGGLLVTDEGAKALFRVNPTTGAVTTVHAGTPFVTLRDVFVEVAGTILVADRDAKALFRVDPITGAVSTVRSGAPFVGPIGVVVSRDGTIYVTDFSVPAIFRIVGASVTTVKSLAPLSDPAGILVDPGGNLVVADGSPAIFLVSPGTGEVATVKGGGPFKTPRSVASVPSPTRGIWVLTSGGSAGVILQVQDIVGIGNPFPFTVFVTVLDGFATGSPSWRLAGGTLSGPGLTQLQGQLVNASAVAVGTISLDFTGRTYGLTQGSTSTTGNMTHVILTPE